MSAVLVRLRTETQHLGVEWMVDPRYDPVYLVCLGEIVLRLLGVPELPQGLAQPDEEAGHDARGVTVVKPEGWQDGLTVGGGRLPSV